VITIAVFLFPTLLGMQHLRPVPNHSLIPPPPRPIGELTLEEIMAAPEMPDEFSARDYTHLVEAKRSYKRWKWAWYTVSALDVLSTAYALHNGAVEANPVLNEIGIHPSVASAGLTVGLSIPIHWWSKRDPLGAKTAMKWMSIFRGAVVLNNINVILED